MINLIVLEGRLTTDPVCQQTPNGKIVCDFSVAVQRNYRLKNSKDYPVDFFACSAWGQTAEYLAKNFAKGSRIVLQGSMQQKNYTDEMGNVRYAYEVMVSQISGYPSKWKNEKKESAAPLDQPQTTGALKEEAAPLSAPDSESFILDDFFSDDDLQEYEEGLPF